LFHVRIVVVRLAGACRWRARATWTHGVVTFRAHGSRCARRAGEVAQWVGSKYPLGADRLRRIKGQKGATVYPVSVQGEDAYIET
jgi:hypothetical protein